MLLRTGDKGKQKWQHLEKRQKKKVREIAEFGSYSLSDSSKTVALSVNLKKKTSWITKQTSANLAKGLKYSVLIRCQKVSINDNTDFKMS